MSDQITHLTTALKNEQVIPDIIPPSIKFTPSVLFSIIWPSNGTEATLGNKIAKDMTQDEPDIKILSSTHAMAEGGHSGDDVSYTLVMTDPDAPSRNDPKFGEWRHWIVAGLKLPAENTDSLVLKGKPAITPYYPPAPPPGSGFHRYVFLLFQEPAGGVNIPKDNLEHNPSPASRRSWNAMAFADKHDLKLVGANFLLTETTP
ncbi:PEBP-like protein [Phlegmacium glaucopus]|nr:PEBP-like protein [Phlegmacium glaucopus]